MKKYKGLPGNLKVPGSSGQLRAVSGNNAPKKFRAVPGRTGQAPDFVLEEGWLTIDCV